MRFVQGLGLCAVVLGCHGGAREGGLVRPGVGASATSLPAARVSYGAAMVMEEGAPISLTAGDGTGLVLASLDARAVVDGPLAFTELHLAFDNPEDRVLEGRFAIRLPENAAISRFAMKIDGAWMEAEVVERMAARRAYEDFLHRKQDPALLEKEAGNEFSARVFPIPAKGRKELIVSYSQELADVDQPYVLPLVGLPRIAEVKARIQSGDTEVTLDERDWTPDADLAAPGSDRTHALGAGKVVAMRVEPELAAAPQTFTSATILVDTSASRAAGFPAYAKSIDELVAALAVAQPGLEVRIAAFDQGVAELYRGDANAAAGQIETALRGRMPLGASNLGAALAWAGEERGRVIVVTDGVATAGEVDAAKLGAVGLEAERVDVVLAGGLRDRATAKAIAHDGAVLDLDDGGEEVARRIALETQSGIAVSVKGAAAVWPSALDGVQPGDAAMVYAWFDTVAPSSVSFALGGDARSLEVDAAVEPLLARAAAQAEIARLEASLDGGEGDAKTKERIVEISTRERVLSSYTAMLVLETEDDYARFGIDRKALAGILVIGPKGLTVQQRSDIAVIAEDTRATSADEPDKNEKKMKETGAVQKDGLVDAPGTDQRDDRVMLDGGSPAPSPEPTVAEPSVSAPPPPRERPQSYDGRADARVASESVGRRPDPGDDGGSDEEADEELEADGGEPAPVMAGPPPLTGRLATVMDLIAAKKAEAALDEALDWRGDDPADVMALVGLGEAFEATGQTALASRAYGSIIDLFPSRADMRRFAGERLDRLGADHAELALDTYRRAVEQRPDHVTGHRLLAFALVRAGRLDEAFAALENGLAQEYPDGRFLGYQRVLAEDLGLVSAAWQKAEPKRAGDIRRRAKKAGATVENGRSMRFVLTWETDANDVDFHIVDARRGHAYYSSPRLASGGELYADVTTGYGPECFTIRGTPKAAPYRLSLHYYSRGPMGFGMGKLEVVRHDGKGTLTFEQRPFIVMEDGAYVDLGTVE